MRPLYFLALFPIATIATLNGHCTGSAATGDWGESGICIYTSTCDAYGGYYKDGACPYDTGDIKCCLIGLDSSSGTDPCGGLSYCDWTSNTCEGSRHAGYCPGGSNYECCLV